MQISEPNQARGLALFHLGFRPFFLFGAVASLALMAIWLMWLGQGHTLHQYYVVAQYWHGHEMLFGYGIAIIAGFLLTAVRNWTSIQTPYGYTLAGIFAVWLAGRVLPVISESVSIPGELIALVDIVFLPLVALSIGLPIVRSGNHRNLVFIVILLAMTVANTLIHLQLLGITEDTLPLGMQLGLNLIVMVMAIMGGRVIPFFSERALAYTVKKYDWLEKAVIPAAAAWMICHLLGFTTVAIALAIFNGIIHTLRLLGWFSTRLKRNPLIWILHIAYLFIPLGFLMEAASNIGLMSPYLAIHAFAAGAIGSMTLGMMARVSLGHTARPLKIARITIAAFVVMVLAGLIRVLLPAYPPLYSMAIHISGGLWCLAWAMFLIPYTPILLKPRLDGQYG